MKIQPYISKLNKSPKFKRFIEENPKSYFAAGFFVLDFEKGNNIHQIDYYIPTKKKMGTFALDKGVIVKESELSNQTIPKKIQGKIKLDLDNLKGIVEDEMKNNTVTAKVNKIIAVIQNIENKLVWNLNCLTNDMGIIKIHIDDDTHSVLKFEKINLFDIIRKV
ncbi:MAG TPA: hypothetical protein P5277_01800 [Candidatus Paceibacterota bacterium]|nr:hypothetical protein [Candidatus Paceibacterota bacterium]